MLGILLLCGLCFGFGWRYGRLERTAPAARPDTVYVTKWKRDSARVQSSSLVATVPVFLPLFCPEVSTVHDTTVVRDSVLVSVPIEERTFTGENYRAILRGFRPEIVDIWIKQVETKVTVSKRKRWSFTVGPQVGVGITTEGWRPYAGAGVTFGYSF